MRMANSKSAPSKPPRKTGGGSTKAPARPQPAGGIVKQAAARAKGPAVAVGVAAAGDAGARALKGRIGRKTVLGVPVPRSLAGASLPDLDARSIAKTIGQASQRFAETSKAVAKDIERAGDQAESIGRLLR